jgi:hypothetical protein
MQEALRRKQSALAAPRQTSSPVPRELEAAVVKSEGQNYIVGQVPAVDEAGD